MATGSQRVELQLNPGRLSSIINGAVVATSEIVNFHFNALAGADLTNPAESGGRFRINSPNISAADRRSLHESWILARAFQELLRAVRHSLEEAYVFVALLSGTHRTKSSTTLLDFLSPFKKRASALKFPELLEAVNAKLDPKIEFATAYVSLQIARNCLEHRAGIISRIETHEGDRFVLRVPRMKTFYVRNGEEIELEPGHIVEPENNEASATILMKIEVRERSFGLGDRLTFTPTEFNEIAFACYFLGQQLASRLPRPQTGTTEPNASPA